MDRRMQKTRAAIFAAFEDLLAKKSYSKITIQELIDEANVGRSTFYSHFETKDDLLRAMCSELFDHIFSENLTAEKTHDFSLPPDRLKAMLTHILYHLKDDAQRLKRLFACESSELFWQYFRQPFTGLVTRHILPDEGGADSFLPRDFLINHISVSFIELVKWWFKNGLREPPETVESYFEAVVFGVV